MAPRNSYSSNRSKGFAIGIVCILIGILLLGFNMGYLPMSLKPIVFSWPMLLVVLGIIQLSRRRYISGCVLLIVGGCFFLPDLAARYPNLPLHFNSQVLLPVVLIIVGLAVLLNRKSS